MRVGVLFVRALWTVDAEQAAERGRRYRESVCSDEGLTLETSAKHHIPQATNIPYQPC